MKRLRIVALLLSALPAAAFAGCGLAPHQESTAVFPGDGITGFSPVGNVEFCIGNTRVVAPSVAAGAELAFCVPDGVAPHACGADRDCDPREHCFCGRCAVRACDTSGRGCDQDELCQGGHCTKRCTLDTDCTDGFVCRVGACSRTCAGDGDCAYGELCDSLASTCRVTLCGALHGNCAQGQSCEALESVGEMHEPELVGASGVEHAYLALDDGTKTSIYRARLDTELRWVADPAKPVLEPEAPGDNGAVGAPALIVEGGGFTLYFSAGGGSRIARAHSPDGASFTRDAAPVLVADPGGWEAGRVASPSVVAYHGKQYLLYEGGRGAGIGVATIDGDAATRLSDQPLLTPKDIQDDIFWRAVDAVGTPYAMVVDDVVRVFFTGRGAEGTDALDEGKPLPADVNDSIGLVTTRDFVHFERFPVGPVFARRTNLRAYLGEREPFVRRDGDRTRLLFVGGDAAGTVSGISLAADPP